MSTSDFRQVSAAIFIVLEGGCTWPFIVRLEGEDETQLAINITEEEVLLQQLAAGETFSCDWNQIAWRTEEMRFSQVPPRHYQIKFPYVFEETDAGSGDKWKGAESAVFAIE